VRAVSDRPTVRLSKRYAEAVEYAARLHGDQVRKSTSIPYVAHLLSVSALVIDDGGSEDEAIAALLHDAAEDQGGEQTLADIRADFGERVADIVLGCTDTMEDPKPDWRPRKERYLAHLEEADEGTMRVSLADKVDNTRAIRRDFHEVGPAVFDRFRRPAGEQLWYYRSLVEIFQRRYPGALASELARTVDEIERLVAVSS